jgi:uroporphyrinogen decarboxylase
MDAFAGKKPERVPVGFWFHYTPDEILDGFKNPGMFEANIEGTKKFYHDFQPDMVKIMTDGFFAYPNENFIDAQIVNDLKRMCTIGDSNPWIEKQVEYAKTITAAVGKDVCTFYNIFAPATLFRFGHYNFNKNLDADALLAALTKENRKAVKVAFQIVAHDMAVLAKRVITEADVDGIYYSTQDPADKTLDEELRKDIYEAADLAVLEAANSVSQMNILHVCGYAHYKNRLEHFADYPAQMINWASVVEGVPLGEGRKIFGGKPVLGGFGNTKDDILYKGSKADIEAETARLLAEAGTAGTIIGADCTVPRDTPLDHLRWVRDAASKI